MRQWFGMIRRYSGRIMGVVSGDSHLIKGKEVNQQSKKRAPGIQGLVALICTGNTCLQYTHTFIKAVVTVVNRDLFY